MNDLIELAIDRAIEKFAGSDQTFNAACLSLSLREISCVDQLLDGKIVRAILTGRSNIKVLPGDHYRRVA